MVDYQLVLHEIRPDVKYSISSNSYADIVWLDMHRQKPTDQECIDAWMKITNQQDALINYSALPDWAKTGTANEAETCITNQIFSGQTQAQVDAWIDTNVTNIATAKIALKQIAGAVITMRGLFVLTAKLLIYIRDLVIRFRQ